MAAKYKELQELIMKGRTDKVKEMISSLLDNSNDPSDIIRDGIIGGMSIVGEKFSSGEMYIPEVMASANAANVGTAILKPMVVEDKISTMHIGKIVIGTVKGDLHNIGKNIVSMLFESVGFEVVDLGVDIQADKFVTAVMQEHPNILGLSALLTTTMPEIKNVIDALEEASVRDKVRVMIGGAPITQRFANSVGADGYAPDGPSAVDRAKELMD